jgi:Mg/Co/Ni transporter MgtE
MNMILDIVGVDPAVASGPLESTINGTLAVAAYFSVATAILLFMGIAASLTRFRLNADNDL